MQIEEPKFELALALNKVKFEFQLYANVYLGAEVLRRPWLYDSMRSNMAVQHDQHA